MRWTEPKTWRVRETLTAEKLNKEVREKFSYLFKRPRSYFKREPYQDITFSSSVWFTTGIKGEIETSGGDLMFLPNIRVQNNTVGTRVYYDIKLNNDVWLSNPGGTQPTWGLATIQTNANVTHHIGGPFFWLNAPPGKHTWELYQKTSTTNTGTIHNNIGWGTPIVLDIVEL